MQNSAGQRKLVRSFLAVQVCMVTFDMVCKYLTFTQPELPLQKAPIL